MLLGAHIPHDVGHTACLQHIFGRPGPDGITAVDQGCPAKELYSKIDFIILFINAIVYALAIFAYAAFDKVLVGLVYSVIVTIIAGIILLQVKSDYKKYPVITYTTITYTLGTVLAIIFRFH